MEKKVLIIEDEVRLARFVELELKYEGYGVAVAHNGREGLEKFLNEEFQLILLDLMLPEINGLEVCRKIRNVNKKIPIIMLTAKGEVMDKVVGLDSGADDYVTKPFAIEEVLARMRVAFKRTEENKNEQEENAALKIQNVLINPNKRTVKVDGQSVELTKKEFDLLLYMAENKNIVLTRDQMLNQVWGYEYIGETNVVDVYIRYLRSKLDDKFEIKLIHTIRGVGYFVKAEEE